MELNPESTITNCPSGGLFVSEAHFRGWLCSVCRVQAFLALDTPTRDRGQITNFGDSAV